MRYRICLLGPDEVLPLQVSAWWRRQVAALPCIEAVSSAELAQADAVLAVLPGRRPAPRLAYDLGRAQAYGKVVIGVTLDRVSSDPFLWLGGVQATASLRQGVERLYEHLGLPPEWAKPLQEARSLLWVGFCGLAGAGKDTAAAALLQQGGWAPLAFADALREVYSQLYPYELIPPLALRESSYKERLAFPNGLTHRQGLQRLGTEVGRQLSPDLWVEHVRYRAEECRRLLARGICLTDVRFPEEADFVHSQGGILIRVERPGLQPLEHSSERQNLDVDGVVWNTSTPEALWEQVMGVVGAKLRSSCPAAPLV